MEQYHKCQNYNLCKENIPEWMHRCITCDITFGEWDGGKGILEEYPNHECPICLDTKMCFEQPRCKHPICADCFRTIYFGDVADEIIISKIGREPEHPYQHILDQFENLDYSDLESDPEKYPLVAEWKIRDDIWYRMKENLIEELSTSKCCLCRLTN
jgi:hypothetical protein